jgi:TRAP-type C4-dicarboxylate transport system substrate-binding protein
MRALLSGIIIAASLATISAPVSASEVVLRLSFFGGTNDSTYSKVVRPWLEGINAEGKGILKIDGYPAGSLVPNPRAQVKAVTDGVVDIAFVVFSYTPGRFPDNSVLELPTLYKNVKESADVIRTLYEKGMLRGFEQFYVPMLVTTYPYNFHTVKPVKTIADLKGMKLRAGGPVAGAAMRALGVAPVGMPIPAVAENISKGVLDGTAVDWNVMYSFRINEVAKNHYMQLFSTVPIGLLMTKKRFEALPPKAQELIKKHSGRVVDNSFVKVTTEIQAKWLAKTKATPGHTIVYPDAADTAAYQKIMDGVIEKWAGSDDRRKNILKTVKAELKKLRSAK